jgi:hypothetical protein
VLDAAELWPARLLLVDKILMFGMPFAATRTASKRTFLLGWHWLVLRWPESVLISMQP